ncbi:MAG: hypothetical protein RL015_2665 [Verrucomicrobiota bacterium]|jgi:hypothetical protein
MKAADTFIIRTKLEPVPQPDQVDLTQKEMDLDDDLEEGAVFGSSSDRYGHEVMISEVLKPSGAAQAGDPTETCP